MSYVLHHGFHPEFSSKLIAGLLKPYGERQETDLSQIKLWLGTRKANGTAAQNAALKKSLRNISIAKKSLKEQFQHFLVHEFKINANLVHEKYGDDLYDRYYPHFLACVLPETVTTESNASLLFWLLYDVNEKQSLKIRRARDAAFKCARQALTEQTAFTPCPPQSSDGVRSLQEKVHLMKLLIQ